MGLSFGLNRSVLGMKIKTPDRKNHISMKNTDFCKQFFLLDTHTSKEGARWYFEFCGVLFTWYEKQKWKDHILVYCVNRKKVPVTFLTWSSNFDFYIQTEHTLSLLPKRVE